MPLSFLAHNDNYVKYGGNWGENVVNIFHLSPTIIQPYGLTQAPHRTLAMPTDSKLKSGMANGKHPMLKIENAWVAIV